MKQRRPQSTLKGEVDVSIGEDRNRRLRQRRREWREIRMRYLMRASLMFCLVLLLVSASTHSSGLLHPKGAYAKLNDYGNLSHEPSAPTINDGLPVLCSSELNAYCPPTTRCCPRYHKEEQLSSRRQLLLFETPLITSTIVGYTCLTSSSGHAPPGLCCADDEQEGEASTLSNIGSGCAVGYTCAAPTSTSNLIDDKEERAILMQVPHCVKDDSSTPIDLRGKPIDNKYELMPRYRTCPAFAMQDIATPFGLPIPLSAASYHNTDDTLGGSDGAFIGQLAYFTNMGPLITSTSYTPAPNSNVKTAVIAIHGSGRDALSYLCAIIAAVAEITQNATMSSSSSSSNWREDIFHSNALSTIGRRHLRQQNEKGNFDTGITYSEEGDILTIAPWFLSADDGQPKSSSDLAFLQWSDTLPIAHTFRYGAESVEVPIVNEDGRSEKTGTISSFAALDVLLETLCEKANYPQLERIVVVGHSAGGQIVHRWGVTSDSWCFGDDNEGVHPAAELPSIRLVAANPRNYAYLDKRRYLPPVSITEDASILEDNGVDGEDTLSPFDKLQFRLPTEPELDDCQEYDEYIWGLENNTRVPAPYVSSRVNKFMASGDDGRTKIFCRYASRDVVYLSGERDSDKMNNQIADGDGYQGLTRRERSERFFASLQVLGSENLYSCTRRGYTTKGLHSKHVQNNENTQVHRRVVVDNVGHDHTLLFQSSEGLASMFSDYFIE